MVHLERVLAEGELEAEKVRKACKAAESIYHWVMAVRNYYFVYKNRGEKKKLFKYNISTI